LSSMVGMQPEDFSSIASRGGDRNFGVNLITVFKTLFHTASWPFFLLVLIGLVHLLVKVIRRKGSQLERFTLINILLALAMFLFLTAGPRFLAIVYPFFILAVVFFIVDLWRWLKKKEFLTLQKVLVGLLAIVLILEILYGVNTNLLKKPVGQSPVYYSQYRFFDRGFNQLEDYLQAEVFNGQLPKIQPLRSMEDFSIDISQLTGRDFILFDETIDWFAYSWYIQKYPLVYRLPVISFDNLLRAIPEGSDPLVQIKLTNVRSVYYIFAADESVADSVKIENKAMTNNMFFMAQLMRNRGADVKEIKDHHGTVVFEIYHLEY